MIDKFTISVNPFARRASPVQVKDISVVITITVNSEIFATVTFPRNFAYANKTLSNG